MKFKNSQDDWEINLPSHVTDIGLKISGGDDSAIVAYMLAKYVSEERPDINIHPVTLVAVSKPYQYIYASTVLRKIEELTGIIFSKHHHSNVDGRNVDNYVKGITEFMDSLYQQNIFAYHYAGITANPTNEDAPELYTEGIPPGRTKKETKKDNWHLPLVNVDKRGVAEHYNTLGVMEELFPLTRSCESHTTDFSKHCGTCWFCKERYWGFGRYV